jgi:hypothetical protein
MIPQTTVQNDRTICIVYLIIATPMRQLAQRIDTHAHIQPMAMDAAYKGISTAPESGGLWIKIARLWGLGYLMISYHPLREPCPRPSHLRPDDDDDDDPANATAHPTVDCERVGHHSCWLAYLGSLELVRSRRLGEGTMYY